jgi:hypothetical protein
MKRRLTFLLSGPSFLWLLGAATLGPLFLALLHHHTDGLSHSCATTGLKLLTLVSAPHVLTTLYLVLDRQNLAGIPRPAMTIAAIPLALIAFNYAVLLTAPLWAVLAYMLAYVHVSMWHFGRQNLGVLAFATRISNGRPMTRFERWTITAGVVAGVLGAYRIFAPDLLLDADAWPLDFSDVHPVFSRLWYGGVAIYALLIPASLAYVLARRSQYQPLSGLLYLSCVFFFLPAYVADKPLLLFTSWLVAHGVQYLVFVAFHAAGQARGRFGLRALAPLAVFSGCLVAGVALWRFSEHVQHVGDHEIARLAIATTTALTLAHYWIDQYLWRFGNPQRRAWLAQSYRFVTAGSTKPVKKPALV